MTPAASQRFERWSVRAIWLMAIGAALFIGFFGDPDRALVSVSIAMLLLVLLSALLQLIVAKPEGFIHRMSLSLAGAVIVLGFASAVFAVLGARAAIFA